MHTKCIKLLSRHSNHHSLSWSQRLPSLSQSYTHNHRYASTSKISTPYGTETSDTASDSATDDWKDFQTWQVPHSGTSSGNIMDRLVNPAAAQSRNRRRHGVVTEVINTVATIDGFYATRPEHMVTFENGAKGMVLSVQSDGCKVGMIEGTDVSPGTKLSLDHNYQIKPPQILVGPGTCGHILDPLGREFKFTDSHGTRRIRHEKETTVDESESDEKTSFKNPVYRTPIFPNSKFMTQWDAYSRQRTRIHTGVKAIDTFYPIAKGWRTAVIGSSDVNRSELAIDLLLSFQNTNALDNAKQYMHGIYVMIGKPLEEIRRLYTMLQQTGALEYTTVIAATDTDLPTMQYIAPYAGAAVADFYKCYGMHSFIIYDDFSTHNRISATLFRESSGLMTYGNWSGELLERACSLDDKFGGGSHTAVAIAERSDDTSDTLYYYLPYLVSHVDTHMLLSNDAFERGLTPPISLIPVPYGAPKFQTGFLRELSNAVRTKLFDMVESEKSARNQKELGLILEPDLERISSNVYKLEVIFSQKYDTSYAHLIVLLSACVDEIVERIHLSKIGDLESRLMQYFIDATPELHNAVILQTWNALCEMDPNSNDNVSSEFRTQLSDALELFLDDNTDLCRPDSLDLDDW